MHAHMLANCLVWLYLDILLTMSGLGCLCLAISSQFKQLAWQECRPLPAELCKASLDLGTLKGVHTVVRLYLHFLTL